MILSMTYGIQTQLVDDPYIANAEVALQSLAQCGNAGSWLGTYLGLSSCDVNCDRSDQSTIFRYVSDSVLTSFLVLNPCVSQISAGLVPRRVVQTKGREMAQIGHSNG